MASETYGDAVFGLRDLKITNSAGSSQEDLGAASMLDIVPLFKTGRLEGDDAVKSVISFITMAEGNLRAGQYSSAAVAIMLGLSLGQSGSSPNEITTLNITGGARMPYFKIYGQAYDDATGDLHLLCNKCKITEFNATKLEDGNWRVTEAKVDILPDGSNNIISIVQHETAAAVPSS